MSTNAINNSSAGIAIAGLGFGESVHLPALQSNKGLKPIALWHPQKSRLEKAFKETQINCHENWSQLLEDPAIDGVIIATPPAPRYHLAYEALKAGKHLLLEKPVALTSEEILSLQKLAINNKLSVAVDFEYRAVPLFMQAKRLISNGEIGEPWLIKFDWLMSSRADSSRPWNWYSQVESGGGVIGALGTHAFDILHWLCGPTINVAGEISTSIRKRVDPTNGEMREVTSEDVALAQLEIEGIDGKSVIPAQVSLSAVSRNGRGCWLEIYGSKGSLILGSNNQKDYVHGFGLWFASVGENLRQINPEEDLMFSKTWKDGRIAPVARLQSWWHTSIKSGSPMIPGVAEGLASQRVCEKLRESATTGIKLAI